MIFVDSNVPMYIVGTSHPNQDRAIALTRELVQSGETLITSVEVYQGDIAPLHVGTAPRGD